MVAPFLKQAWVVSGVLLNMMAQGMALGYTSSLLPGLRAPDSPIHIDLDTASLLSSSLGISGIPGLFLSSFIMDFWGRKVAHLLFILPGVVGWTLLYYAASVPSILTARILCGITAAATVSVGAVVIGECTSPNNRGMFLNLKTASVCCGGTLVHILQNFYHWRTIALVALLPHIAALIIVATWPETPAFLASKKQFDRAEKSFFWLRGKSDDSVKELKEMIKAQMSQASKEDISFKDRIKEFFKKFTRKDFLKPVFIVCVSMLLLEASGRHIFPAYALDIIGELTGDKSQSFYYTLAVDLIIALSSTFSSFLVRIMKRRSLLFGTGFAALGVITVVCIYLFLASFGVISKERTWIPIGLFIVYFTLVNLGCTPIPLALLGEIFPLEHRGAGSVVAGVVLATVVYIGLQVTPYLLVGIKVHGAYAVFGGTMGVLLVVLYFILPETKDRTLQEIEDYFKYGKFLDETVINEKVDDETQVRMLSGNEMKKNSFLK